MRESTYKEKCEELFKKAKDKGVELIFDSKNYSAKKLNCLWHGGNIAYIKFPDGLMIDIFANGDVIATLFDKDGEEIARSKDKSNVGAFEENMRSYINTDKQLQKVIRSGRLVLSNNNWIEYDGLIELNGVKHIIDLYMYVDNLLDDNILIAIEQVLDDLDECKNEILKLKEAEYGVSC